MLIPSNDISQNSAQLPNANSGNETLPDLDDDAYLTNHTEPKYTKLHSTNSDSSPTWSTQISLSSGTQYMMTSPMMAINVTTEAPLIQFQADSQNNLTWNMVTHDQDAANVSNMILTTGTITSNVL